LRQWRLGHRGHDAVSRGIILPDERHDGGDRVLAGLLHDRHGSDGAGAMLGTFVYIFAKNILFVMRSVYWCLVA
jgi:hypothetical protein